jgi:hypothetical protein
MTSPGTFGRRSAARPTPTAKAAIAKGPAKATAAGIDKLFPTIAAPAATRSIASLGPGEGVSPELAEWKAERKQAFRMPWRQLSLMAGLCFGVGSFVLPDSVNGVTDWVLYGLMAMSFIAGLSGKRKAK